MATKVLKFAFAPEISVAVIVSAAISLAVIVSEAICVAVIVFAAISFAVILFAFTSRLPELSSSTAPVKSRTAVV